MNFASTNREFLDFWERYCTWCDAGILKTEYVLCHLTFTLNIPLIFAMLHVVSESWLLVTAYRSFKAVDTKKTILKILPGKALVRF